MTLKEFLNNGDKFAKYIGIELTDVKPGMAKATMTVTEQNIWHSKLRMNNHILILPT